MLNELSISVPAPLSDIQMNTQQQAKIALMPCGDLFEDFFDTIGVSFETFRTKHRGSWMFNYVSALELTGVQTVLFFISARVSETLRFKHEPSGAEVRILPAPFIHRAFRYVTSRTYLSKRWGIRSLDSYLVLPLGLLARELRNEGCNAVLFQDYENPSFDICVLLGRLMQIPVFATFQGGGSPRSRFIEHPTRTLALHACAGLIIPSQTEMKRVITRYKVPTTKLTRIFNPINVTSWVAVDRDEVRSEFGIPLDAKVVVFHGRIDIVHKGLDILLESWDQICRERPERDLRLLLIGTGSDAEKLRDRITAMQLRGVMWINKFVHDGTLLSRYLSSANVYTLPSRFEGFPVAPLEAMACGLPIVATDAPGVPEILEFGEASGGLMVSREDSVALATALGSLLDNEAWARELGKRARLRVQEYFSLEVIGKQLRNLLLK